MIDNDNDNVDDTGTDEQSIGSVVRSVTADVKSEAKDVVDSVTAEAKGYADRTKTAAADEVKNVAAALRSAADDLRYGSAQERTFSQIADGLADASDAIRDKDLGEIVGSLNDFAKRNPLVFLGSAALIGFAATRFAKATGATGSGTYDAGSHRGGAYNPDDRSRDDQARTYAMTGETE